MSTYSLSTFFLFLCNPLPVLQEWLTPEYYTHYEMLKNLEHTSPEVVDEIPERQRIINTLCLIEHDTEKTCTKLFSALIGSLSEKAFYKYIGQSTLLSRACTLNSPYTKTLSLAYIKQAQKSKEVCPISFENYEELETLSLLSCGHVFCSASLATWFNTNKSCPVCRCKKPFVINYKKS